MSEQPDFEAILRDLERPIDYDKLAAEEAARTDPWKWYCRLCGAKGSVDHGDGAREQRDQEAKAHLTETPCGRFSVTGQAESGRLLHVWTYPPSAAAHHN